MVTGTRKNARRRLYLEEWIAFRGLSDEKLGARMGKARQTVYRWRAEQHRLTPDKIADLAQALDIEPEDLWRPPGRQSIDAILKEATEQQVQDTLDFVHRFVIKRAS